MRLIDADALVEALMMYTWTDEDGYEIDDAEPKREFIKGWMPTLPTVDAVPVKHGTWVTLDTSDAYDLAGVKTWVLRAKCNKCGFAHKFIEAHTGQYVYCPSCGAKMNEEGDGK